MRNVARFIFSALFILLPLNVAVAEDLYEMEDLDDHGPRAGYIAQNEGRTLELLARQAPSLESFEIFVMDHNWQDVSLKDLALSANILAKAGGEPAIEYTCSATEINFTCKAEGSQDLVSGNILDLRLKAPGKELQFLYTYPFENEPIR